MFVECILLGVSLCNTVNTKIVYSYKADHPMVVTPSTKMPNDLVQLVQSLGNIPRDKKVELARRMRYSPNRWVRMMWWFPVSVDMSATRFRFHYEQRIWDSTRR